MRFYEQLSFRSKLILQAMLAATVPLVLALIALASYDLFHDQQRVVESLNNHADQLAPTIAAAIAFDDVITAEESLAVLANDPQILVASVHDGDGTLFAGYTRADVQVAPTIIAEPAKAQFRGDYLELVREVALGGDRLGTIFLRRSVEDIEFALQQRLLIGLAVFLAALVVALVTAAWLGRQISRPVRELVNATEAFAQGEYAARAEKLSSDEIGVLTDGFNQMLGEIEMRGIALTRARDELEERVEERTRDLAQSRADLETAKEAGRGGHRGQE